MVQVLNPVNHPGAFYRVDYFLAGGISDCPDWQREVLALFSDTRLALANPRRDDFVMSSDIEEEQIHWEYCMLRNSDRILFWFPRETLCPITLFELADALGSRDKRDIFIGVHPGYARRNDVIIQSRLRGYDRRVYFDLPEMVDAIRVEEGYSRIGC